MTKTSLGQIPYFKWRGMTLCVALDLRNLDEPNAPLMFNGKYVYAIPGGGIVCP